MNATSEDFVDRAIAFVACRVDKYFKNVSCSGSTVNEGVLRVNRHTIDKPIVFGKLAVDGCQSTRAGVDPPEFDGVVVSSHEAIRILVEELDVLALLVHLGAGRTVGL